MKKFQIVEVTENSNHAGSKANNDIAQLATESGYQSVMIRSRTNVNSTAGKLSRQIGYAIDWLSAYNQIEANSLVLLQHPFHTPHLTRNLTLRTLKKKKNVKYISLVHDVESLREYRYNEYYKQEFEMMLEIADVIVVHNEIMKTFFANQGYPTERLVTLQIFDYLMENDIALSPKQILCESSVSIAGNLDSKKAKYLSQLDELPFQIHLYGPNYVKQIEGNSRVHYHGSLKPEDVPHHLDRGFGLVWDGSSIRGCEGPAGNYIRYNNPHKLSLYLASGLPVIIWAQAAEANFVMQNQVGYVVDSLEDIVPLLDGITTEVYQDLLGNVKKIQQKLVKGHYTISALKLAEYIVESR